MSASQIKVTEISNEGLKREYRVTVGREEIKRQAAIRLNELSKRVKIPGFRPGKIPMNILEQRYGTSVMGEVIEKTVQDTSGKAVNDHGLRPAMRPKIEITSLEDEGDLEYTMAVEILPDFKPVDLTTIELDKPVYAVPDSEIDEALNRIASNNKSSEPVTEDRPAAIGDIVTIDFKGTVDGEARPGMDAPDFDLELGSGSFVDTFEQQLVGAKPGDHRTVTVTFPEEYGAAELAGRQAVFEVDVKGLKKPIPAAIDDEMAKSLGMESLDKLKEAIRNQIQGDYDSVTKLKMKRALLDVLAEKHDFPVPQGMVEIEFEAIWRKVQDEMKGEDGEPEKSEDEMRAEYRQIAERRVRLGLLLNEIGRSQNLQVTQEEINRALFAEARRYQGQEKAVIDFYRNNPSALENIRAPLYEDKVVSYVLTQTKLNDKPISRDELVSPMEDED